MSELSLEKFDYHLPDEKIAKFPLTQRDQSKLLFFDKGDISHKKFHQLPEILPEKSLVVFNNTKVIPARLYFKKDTGASIEILLLEPCSYPDFQQAMQQKKESRWKCMVGNLKKWKNGSLIAVKDQIQLEATLIDREKQELAFTYPEELTFSEVLAIFGFVPLPPYLKRAGDPKDKDSYQTVYAKNEGAVAAPTAGLHFTNKTFDDLSQKGIKKLDVTLHISSGTFQPVKTEDIREHPMHNEYFEISYESVNQLCHQQKVIAVGTTSLRTLESLYWFGCMLQNNPEALCEIPKLYPYENDIDLSAEDAFFNIREYMKKRNIDKLIGNTEIFVFPGYRLRVIKGLITNFHLPKSTLIMLIAALVGDNWKKIYQEALNNNYRFLSYGDSSLLIS